jgi:hypothetical protein
MPRGGRRKGTPGKAYGNRTDLNQPQAPGTPVFKGQPYGAATQQQQAMAAAPPAPPGQPPVSGVPTAGGPPGVPPGGLGEFTRPTERPNEPITHGLPTGPGAGPEAIGLDPRNDAVSLQLRALYQRFPLPEIAELLSEM